MVSAAILRKRRLNRMGWADKTGRADYAWDFTTDLSRWAGSDRGALSNTPGWSFTRASAGYAQTAAGVLVPFASGELRRTDKGVLIEGARTNLCLRSQEFDNASWTKSRASIVANATTAPDGTLTADKLVEDSASGTHRTFQVVEKAASAITYTGSVYAKAGERNFISVKLTDNTETDQVAVGVDLTTGELTAISSLGGGFTSATATATALANGWWRIALTATSDTDTRVTLFAQVSSILSATASYAGDGASGIYIWGAQLEAAAFPSSYIATTTGSVTRAADVPSVTSVNGSDYPVSIYAEVEIIGGTEGANSQGILAFSGAANNSVQIMRSASSVYREVIVAGTTQMDSAAGNMAALGVYKCALRAATNDCKSAMAGSIQSTDTSVTMPSTPSTIDFGNRGGGSSPLFGYLRRLAIFSRALSDGELQAMTS